MCLYVGGVGLEDERPSADNRAVCDSFEESRPDR